MFGAAAVLVDSKPVAAYALPSTTGAIGSGFAVANRSRAGGLPIAGTLSAGDGRAAVPVAADAIVTVSYLEPGPFSLSLTAGVAPGATTSSPVTVTGASLTPTLTYGPGGATSGAQNALVTVRGRLLAPGNVGVGGRTMNFTLGTSSASAVTGRMTSSFYLP